MCCSQSRRRPRRQAGLYRRPAHAHLWPACRPGGALRCGVAGLGHPARRARPAGDARYRRLADRFSRLPEERHRRGAGQHAADRGRLSLHAGRQPRQMPGRVGGAVPEIREGHQGKPRSRARHRLRRQSARLPAVRGRHRRRRAGGLHRADGGRRHGVLALHLGLDRQAERRGARARQPQIYRRSLRHAGRRLARKRRGLFGGEIVLRLRSRQCPDLCVERRRHHRAQSGAADAGRRGGAAQAIIRSRRFSACRPSMRPSWRARARRRAPR